MCDTVIYGKLHIDTLGDFKRMFDDVELVFGPGYGPETAGDDFCLCQIDIPATLANSKKYELEPYCGNDPCLKVRKKHETDTKSNRGCPEDG